MPITPASMDRTVYQMLKKTPGTPTVTGNHLQWDVANRMNYTTRRYKGRIHDVSSMLQGGFRFTSVWLTRRSPGVLPSSITRHELWAGNDTVDAAMLAWNDVAARRLRLTAAKDSIAPSSSDA